MTREYKDHDKGMHHRAFAFFVLLIAILIGFGIGYVSGWMTGESHAMYLLQMGRDTATTSTTK